MSNRNPKSFARLHSAIHHLEKTAQLLCDKNQCNALQRVEKITVDQNTCKKKMSWEYLPIESITNYTPLPKDIWNIVNLYNKTECVCFDKVKEVILQMDYYRIEGTNVLKVEPLIEVYYYPTLRSICITIKGFNNINKKMACHFLGICIDDNRVTVGECGYAYVAEIVQCIPLHDFLLEPRGDDGCKYVLHSPRVQ